MMSPWAHQGPFSLVVYWWKAWQRSPRPAMVRAPEAAELAPESK
ncbi:MAG TPA: hypothetical protein VFW64_02325 [Pseudonocardiaceae bacterium]|nr:hypothetical protein [Pseudonocardiaceae bacterium]